MVYLFLVQWFNNQTILTPSYDYIINIDEQDYEGIIGEFCEYRRVDP